MNSKKRLLFILIHFIALYYPIAACADDEIKEPVLGNLDRVSLIHAQVYNHYMGSLGYVEGWISIKTPSPDFVFEKLDINELSFEEKKRLSLLVLLTVKLENAGAIEFAQWFEEDRKKIGAQLRKIPDKLLKERFGFNSERLESFWAKVEIFESDDF